MWFPHASVNEGEFRRRRIAAMAAHPLAALMGAKSPDDVKKFLGAVYRHRADLTTVRGLLRAAHRAGPPPRAWLAGAQAAAFSRRMVAYPYLNNISCASQIDMDGIAATFGCTTDNAVQMIEAAREVVQACLYRAPVGAAAADLARLTPERLDSRLRTLLGEVGRDAHAPQPTAADSRLQRTAAQVLAKLLPAWRAASVDSRVALPRLVDFDWRVDVKTASDAVTRMAVPTLLVDLKVEEQATKVGVMPDTRTVNLEMSREALGTMLAGLQRIRDTLSQIK